MTQPARHAPLHSSPAKAPFSFSLRRTRAERSVRRGGESTSTLSTSGRPEASATDPYGWLPQCNGSPENFGREPDKQWLATGPKINLDGRGAISTATISELSVVADSPTVSPRRKHSAVASLIVNEARHPGEDSRIT